VRRPALGKGELAPEVLIVFEGENQRTSDYNWIIELRKLLKNCLGVEKIYHTYMIRCTPKACSARHSAFCYTPGKLLDKEHNCILTENPCNGVPIKPDTVQILNCLAYLIEEIDILNPHFVLLMGERVSEFVLRSYGFFDSPKPGQTYVSNHRHLITAVNEQAFDETECHKLIPAFSA